MNTVEIIQKWVTTKKLGLYNERVKWMNVLKFLLFCIVIIMNFFFYKNH